MEEILAKLLVADNSVIQQGTAELRAALVKPESTPMLCELIVSSVNPEIRQYATLLLRKRYTKGKHWNQLPPTIRNQVKAILLPGLVNEPDKQVKNGIAQLIGVIVKHELPHNTWPEIFQFIQQLVTSESMTDKELGMYTLATMTGMAPEVYLAHAASLMSLLGQTFSGLQDLGTPVAFYIIQTMLHLTPLVENNQVMVNAYNQMIPIAINAIQALTATSQEKAAEAMELFDDLCESAPTVISSHVKTLIPMCLTIARNKSLDDDLRVRSISLIGCLARTKTKAIVKHKLVEPIVDVLFELMASPPDDENDEIYFSGENEYNTPVTCATETLNLLAIHLKPDKLVPHLLKHIDPGLQSSDICAKKASYLALAVLAEGCAEHIRSKYLESFLRCICQGITDQSPVVRNAALFALGQFSEYLQPEISQYSQQLLPVLFDYLGQMCAHLKQEGREPPSVDRMFYALETFCENLNDALLPYLPTLMDRLFETLSSDSPVHIRELAISAIGAAANASKEHMLPYFQRIIAVLDVYLTNTHTDETICLQVQAVDTLGALARTIGEDNFAPLVGKSLDLGIKLITNTDEPDLRKVVYGLFASIASITKKEMAPVLPQILEHIFNSIQSSEGIVPHFKDGESAAFPIYENASDNENEDEEDIENTDNEDDDDEDEEVAGYSVANSYIEEKEEAVLALREIAHHTEDAFLPFLEKSFEETFKLINYPQEDIKKASIDALSQFCINFSKINTPEGKEALSKAIGVYVPKLSEIIRLDCEPQVVISGLEALADLLNEIKEDVVTGDGHKDAVMNCVIDVFTGKIECQDQDEGEEEDDEAEQDEFLIECAGNVLSYFGKAIQPEEFALYFQKTLPYLKERVKETKSEAQRSFAVGTISECLSGLKHTVAAFVPQLLPLFRKRIEDPSPEVRNNAYYGIGELVLYGKEAVYSHYNEILQLLSQALQREEHAGPRDNMTGVIARLIITNYSLVDLERVFPAFVQQLPLKQDFEEYQAVFRSILMLYRAGHEVIKPHMQTLLKVAIRVLHEKKAPNEETKGLITELINSAQQDFPNDWSTVFTDLPHELQQILSA
ncbi:importin-4 [Fopius arisanus]|uniref:Importin-4 n=1 Tax=Fopius arisanus TaxID=64838 RepID=A0A0C9R8S2_9HYME|nr:PREDICTED: importin-4-like [Fopius arisanus]